MSSIWGRRFIVDIFGESHGPKIGAVITGVPAGVTLDFSRIRAFLDRRRPGGEMWSTKRGEADDFEIVSGYFNGHSTGTPLCVLFHNTAQRPSDYAEPPNRPGHADYTGYVRYNGYNDPRGGGHFSGRLTAPLVFAGAVAAQILEPFGVYAATHIKRIENVEDASFDKTGIKKELAQSLSKMRLPLIDEKKRKSMEDALSAAASEEDSVGGIIECAVCGLPAGLGSPFFDTVESALASLLLAIPAVKGVSFGAGFEFAKMRGSRANDAYLVKEGRVVTATNNNGGVLGGITTGMPLVFETVIKPTASIARAQRTVNLKTLKSETLEIKGRHDSCIVPRAAAAVEAAAYICVLDLFMERSL
ncbi:MAG: chorismate synthase [Christensenellales bacterium]